MELFFECSDYGMKEFMDSSIDWSSEDSEIRSCKVSCSVSSLYDDLMMMMIMMLMVVAV